MVRELADSGLEEGQALRAAAHAVGGGAELRGRGLELGAQLGHPFTRGTRLEIGLLGLLGDPQVVVGEEERAPGGGAETHKPGQDPLAIPAFAPAGKEFAGGQERQ